MIHNGIKMGNNCSGRRTPNYSPTCQDQPLQVDGFCTYASFLGEDRRREACDSLGGAGEWTYDSVGSICQYNDKSPSDAFVGSGCCGTACPIVGEGVVCRRQSGTQGYQGDPVTCCFQNAQFYNDTTVRCLNGNKTCPSGQNGSPNYQLLTGSDCQSLTSEYCTGTLPSDDPNSQDWLNRWNPQTPNNCFTVLNQNLFNQPNLNLLQNGIVVPENLVTSRAGYEYSQGLISQVITKYQQQGFELGALPGYPGYNGFQDTVLQPICRSIPGLCQSGLQYSCSNETTDTLARNPNRVPWCGCYLSSDQYAKYVDEYQVSQQCNPICARQGNIPLPGPSGLGTTPCNQDVCIIDQTTISLAQTEVGGGINFSQFCSGCSTNPQTGAVPAVGASSSSSSCQCIIDNNSIAAANSQIGGGIDLTETCGNTVCYRNNPDPQKYPGPLVMAVDCSLPFSYNPFVTPQPNPVTEAEARYRRLLTYGIIIFVIFVFVLTFILLAIFSGNTEEQIIYPMKHHRRQTKSHRWASGSNQLGREKLAFGDSGSKYLFNDGKEFPRKDEDLLLERDESISGKTWSNTRDYLFDPTNSWPTSSDSKIIPK